MMKIAQTIDAIRAAREEYGLESVGLVPTMGYLHEGHLELVRRARKENDRVIVTIYVNPKQFGPSEDLSRYPRDMEHDLELLSNENVDTVFAPSDEAMYPADYQTTVIVTQVTQPLEGARRPTHFEGVTTVVTKLFNLCRPTRAYFGQKDAQQVAVLRQMVRDLNFNLEIVVCPTVREKDGLALSSRNKYLTAEQRAAAPALHQSLRAATVLWAQGERNSDTLRAAMLDILSAVPSARVDYVSAANPTTLQEYSDTVAAGQGILFSMAVFFGQTRLIDNVLLPPGAE
ncbi:MAG: pantoate--beta-alanine ligase [Anaerolineales bacterium]|nr:pantoate--beta-alanine ligase [Anaerolineales bacterium]MCO5178456.1 pantoate--beta-alanine ligase [Promineifilum sp.]